MKILYDKGGQVQRRNHVVVEKITLMDAYLIEHVRKAGISDEEIIEAVLALDANRFQHVHDSFDFTLLHD